MKRRTFLSTLTAAVAAPALPMNAAAPANHISQHFAKAKLLARCHDRASPEMFARLMKLDGQTAQCVFDLLKDRSVISNGLDGVTRAMNPLNTHCVPNEAIKARDLAKMSSDLGRGLRKMANDQISTSKQPVELNADSVESFSSEHSENEQTSL